MGNNHQYNYGMRLPTKSFLPTILIEKYTRFNIPVLCEDLFSSVFPPKQDLTFVGNIFIANYEEAFESPLDTKLGKALYGK